MKLVSPDLEMGTDLFYDFGSTEQNQILEALADFS
jgi:hypothetical protein